LFRCNCRRARDDDDGDTSDDSDAESDGDDSAIASCGAAGDEYVEFKRGLLGADMSVAQLRAECQRRGEKASGTKQKLIAYILRHERKRLAIPRPRIALAKLLQLPNGATQYQTNTNGRLVVAQHKRHFNNTDRITNYLYRVEFPGKVMREDTAIIFTLFRLLLVHAIMTKRNDEYDRFDAGVRALEAVAADAKKLRDEWARALGVY
jgi:hypothetical protein